MDNVENARQLLLDHLDRLATKVKGAHDYYLELIEHVPEDERWKYQRSLEAASDQFVTTETVDPVNYLGEMADTLALFRRAIELFSSDQLAAFYLGMGCKLLDLPFWGIPQTHRNLERLRSAQHYYDELLNVKVPEEEHWKFMRQIPTPLEFLPLDKIDPREYLPQRQRLIQAQLDMIIQAIMIG